MSRSVKKNPISSVLAKGAEAGIQKEWKKNCNKKLRRILKDEIPNGSKYKKVSGNIWDSPSDGKIRLDPKNKVNYRK